MKRYVTALLVSLGLGMGSTQAQEEPLNAVVTIGMIGDVIENVAAECAIVTTIMGPGVDPHLYQASSGDVQTFQDADIIFYSGYSLEGQLGEVLARFGEQIPTVAVSPESITPAELITTQSIYGIDPHLWMDVSLWSKLAPTIADALAELRPDCAEQFQANAAQYTEQLEALHAWVADTISSIPEQQRILVTAHDAFSYYGRAYGIEVAGVQGLSTESEAGIADIREMADIVAERQVPAVFIESTINPRTVQSVIDATAQRGHQVEIGGTLYSDAMGEGGTAGGTYIGMIYENTTSITQALGGSVPPLPEALSAWAEQWDVETAAR
jgi:manganese/zinc/iron transport system substrate-binding protein